MRSLDVKTIRISNVTVKLFSPDGKLWVSHPSDFRLFEQRRLKITRITRKMVADYIPAKL